MSSAVRPRFHDRSRVLRLIKFNIVARLLIAGRSPIVICIRCHTACPLLPPPTRPRSFLSQPRFWIKYDNIDIVALVFPSRRFPLARFVSATRASLLLPRSTGRPLPPFYQLASERRKRMPPTRAFLASHTFPAIYHSDPRFP